MAEASAPADIVIPKQESAAEALDRIVRIPEPAVQWWVDLVGQLDSLSDRLETEQALTCSQLRAQVSEDAPHLLPAVGALEVEHEDLTELTVSLRLRVGSSAGDQNQQRVIGSAVTELLGKIANHDRRAAEILYLTYDQDLGGESA